MHTKRLLQLTVVVSAATCAACGLAGAQEADESAEPAGRILRGSLVEDRAARKLVEAGDARYEAEETKKAVEIWQSVVERYPRSRVRYEAHMRLGNYFLDKERAHDRARAHFEAIAAEENSDEDQRAEATLKIGSCFYHARNYGKCFQVMRDVIQKFPVSKHVNEAYYFIGLGHFQLGHYSRAIEALEKSARPSRATTAASKKSRRESGCSSKSKTPIWPSSSRAKQSTCRSSRPAETPNRSSAIRSDATSALCWAAFRRGWARPGRATVRSK